MLKNFLNKNHLSHLEAACYAFLAYTLFAFCDSTGKWLMHEGFSRNQVLTISNSPSLIVLSLFITTRYGWKDLWKTDFKFYHILRALSLVSVTYFVFESLKRLDLADFYGIMFSSPLVTTIAAFFIFKELVDIKEWLVILIGFAGVMVVAQPDYADFNVGYLFAFGAVLSVSAAGLIVRKIGRNENLLLFVLYANMAIVSVNIIPALNTSLPTTISSLHLVVFALYALMIPMALLVLTAVFSRAPTVAVVTPFQYTQIVWGGLIGYFVFEAIPQMNTLIGSAIVIACGLYIIVHHKRKSRKELVNINN